MKLEPGKTYRCENGNIFTVRKNNLPFYCFSVLESHSTPTNESEVWTEDGRAYHNDCGYNFIEEVQS